MKGINKVILVGRLGLDPEIRKIENLRSKLLLRLATTESYKNANGEWQDVTDWHNVVMWGPMAERGERDLHKGNLVYIEGKLKTRSWEDRDGHKRYATEVIAEYYQNLSPRESAGYGGQSSATAPEKEAEPDYSRPDEGEEGLPF